MTHQFEAPELTLIGQAEDVVLGAADFGSELGFFAAADFEFEQD